MKLFNYFSFLLLIVSFIFFACEEVGPNINFTDEVVVQVDTNNLERVILLEEFTGVRCPNCPAGSELAEQLAKQYVGKIIIVSIHSGVFSIPYNNAEDFKITEGTQIEALLGKAAAYPSAAINRKLFSGEMRQIIPSNKWNTYIQEELNEAPEVSINLSANNVSANELSVDYSLSFQEAINSTLKISVLLTEDDIVSPQDVDGTKVEDYVHQHVLRDMLTPADGLLLASSVEADTIFEGKLSFTSFKNEWDKNKLSIVAFIHGSGTTLNVLNAAKIKLPK